MIEIKHLCYIYNKKTNFQIVANDNINLSINKGEIVGIIGPTGSGKSTFLKQLSGILKPSSGEIFINGKAIDYKKIDYKVGMVFQYPEHQLFADTVYDDIAFGLFNKGESKENINLIINDSLKFVGLPSTILNKSPFDLSGGEKRRVAIAGIIAMNPEILILDEPTVSLDLKSKKLLINQFKEYHKEKNITLIVVSHDMNDIIDLCDKVIVMKNGKVKKFLNTMDLFYESNDLESYGMEVPPIIKIIKDLKSKGYNLSSNIKSVEDAEKGILRFLGGS